LSLTELLQRTDEDIGRVTDEKEPGVQGADGGLARAENRYAELLARREWRRQELERQRSFSLQSVDRIASMLVLPQSEREAPDVRRIRPNPETEAVAMRVVMEYETANGRQVYDVREKNLGYDVTSLDLNSGEFRLLKSRDYPKLRGKSPRFYPGSLVSCLKKPGRDFRYKLVCFAHNWPTPRRECWNVGFRASGAAFSQ